MCLPYCVSEVEFDFKVFVLSFQETEPFLWRKCHHTIVVRTYTEKNLMELYYLPGNYSIILRIKTTDMECRVRNEVASVWNINILTWTIVVQNFQLSPLHHVLSKYVGLASSLVHKLAVKFHQIKKSSQLL